MTLCGCVSKHISREASEHGQDYWNEFNHSYRVLNRISLHPPVSYIAVAELLAGTALPANENVNAPESFRTNSTVIPCTAPEVDRVNVRFDVSGVEASTTTMLGLANGVHV